MALVDSKPGLATRVWRKGGVGGCSMHRPHSLLCCDERQTVEAAISRDIMGCPA